MWGAQWDSVDREAEECQEAATEGKRGEEVYSLWGERREGFVRPEEALEGFVRDGHLPCMGSEQTPGGSALTAELLFVVWADSREVLKGPARQIIER